MNQIHTRGHLRSILMLSLQIASSNHVSQLMCVTYFSGPTPLCNLRHLYYPIRLDLIIIIIIIFTAIGLLPGGSGYFTCIQNMKLVTTKFKPGGLHEKHVVATWNLGNHLSICL